MHGWSWVRQAALRPQKCAVFPHVNDGAFIDTGNDIVGWDPHVYVSQTAAEQLGAFVGMVPGSDLQISETKLNLANERIEELEREVAVLEEFKQAVRLVSAEMES